MVVLVVDSSAIIIERWKRILSETTPVKTVYGATAYADALLLFDKVKPGVILLDGDLPDNTSINLLKIFKATDQPTTVIVVANNADNYVEEQCKLFGADFFFDKYNDFEKIPAFINTHVSVNMQPAR